jgi:hypothetical protein
MPKKAGEQGEKKPFRAHPDIVFTWGSIRNGRGGRGEGGH